MSLRKEVQRPQMGMLGWLAVTTLATLVTGVVCTVLAQRLADIDDSLCRAGVSYATDSVYANVCEIGDEP